MVSRYFRRRWHESRGDEFDIWGYATYYFDAAEDGWPVRQVEVYDSGPVLRYGPAHREDRFGGLGQGQLDEFEEWAEWEITAAEFERQWNE
ncbi:hypothetical protein FHX75_111242 [Micromonospora palomenae]|uniref:Uncharacterized protein n=1 Tax=Micromonospora palomenae TaxID=1461247 RepID=A0A561WW84_9ACTN|nr:hypothetical protein [Micromonospora palomenae]TWG28091.1 hypothetical protein FHX75_111242 [Micromonospora palomenae]